MSVLREKSARRKLLISVAILAALLGAIATFAKLYPFNEIGEWIGIGKDSNTSETIEAELNPKNYKEIIKITYKETENFQSAKTLWDWLQLGGVIAIPFVLFYFQQGQTKRDKEIADNNLREQALEAYFDRMSELLIDKELKVLISKKLEKSILEYQKLDAAFDIARARTLSVLRRLDQDGERKGNVIRFLIDSELLINLNLNSADLRGAHLDGAHLVSADLSYANLRGADLRGADLRRADLSYANLSYANLSYANLKGANLVSADLSSADLSSAYLGSADLRSADLRSADLRSADLKDADLSRANLRGANLRGAKNLTPDQVKFAKNWDKAKYSKEFYLQLGLSPKAAKNQGE